MNKEEENQDLLSQLQCYVDAVFIDWDDMESQGSILEAFRSIAVEIPRWPGLSTG